MKYLKVISTISFLFVSILVAYNVYNHKYNSSQSTKEHISYEELRNGRTVAVSPKSPLKTPITRLSNADSKESIAISTDDTDSSQINEADLTVDEFLKSRDYASMNADEVNSLLRKMTLGEGDDFENTRKNFVTTIDGFLENNPNAKNPLEFFKGSFTSEFSEITPNNGDAIYSIDIIFKGESIYLRISYENQTFYENDYDALNRRVGTASSGDLVPNIFLELPAKPEIGYIHSLYLELLASNDGQTLLGVLYNTDQFDSSTVHYVHAENLVFKQNGEKK